MVPKLLHCWRLSIIPAKKVRIAISQKPMLRQWSAARHADMPGVLGACGNPVARGLKSLGRGDGGWAMGEKEHVVRPKSSLYTRASFPAPSRAEHRQGRAGQGMAQRSRAEHSNSPTTD